MSQAHASPGSRTRRFTLNSDGKRHPILNTAAAYTVVAGLISAVTGMIVGDHLVAAISGITGFAVGIFAQMLSATREERIFIVFGVVASFVGMGLGLAHGGF
jgi:uncharacterized membrane protein YjjP (DUF1212 family)